nr:cupin domain-containing protein [Tautonia plasticadhaerens]
MMALDHAKPGEVIDVRPLGEALADARTTTLIKAERLEVLRLVLPAGKEIATHTAPGPITVHCLEGRVAFTVLGEERELGAGRMLHLGAGEPHSLRGIEDASLLVTLVLVK